MDNPKRIKASVALWNAGINIDEGWDDLLDSSVPACCEGGCEVEPDGTCEHGHPSVLIAMGVI